jgi:hypothetical protein
MNNSIKYPHIYVFFNTQNLDVSGYLLERERFKPDPYTLIYARTCAKDKHLHFNKQEKFSPKRKTLGILNNPIGLSILSLLAYSLYPIYIYFLKIKKA